MTINKKNMNMFTIYTKSSVNCKKTLTAKDYTQTISVRKLSSRSSVERWEKCRSLSCIPARWFLQQRELILVSTHSSIVQQLLLQPDKVSRLSWKSFVSWADPARSVEFEWTLLLPTRQSVPSLNSIVVETAGRMLWDLILSRQSGSRRSPSDLH